MYSNRYIFIYSTVMVVVVAIILTIVAVALKPIQDNNIRIEKMQNILATIHVDASVKDADMLYKKYISSSFTINSKGDSLPGVEAFPLDLALELKKPFDQQRFPIFVASLDDGRKAYVVPMRGKGLWGPVWGYLALMDDYNTVEGAVFDHKGETPGLGAEINTQMFEGQFKGKQIFDEQGKHTSIKVVKGGARDDDLHGVDAISGGTITSNAVSDMLYDCLKGYVEFFNHQKEKK